MPHRVQLRARAANHFMYWGRSTLVTNADGFALGKGLEGYFAENTRMLNRLALCAGGQRPRAVAVSPAAANRLLAYYEVADVDGVPEGSVYITLDATVTEMLAVALRVENFSLHGERARFDLEVELAADFADTVEAEKQQRQQDGNVDTGWDADRGELWFRYRHPKLDRAARIRVEPGRTRARFEGGSLIVAIDVGSHEAHDVRLEVQPYFGGKPLIPEQEHIGRAQARLRSETAWLETTNDVVARAWRTATADLASLALGHPAGPAAPAAGVPMYQQFFGRDTLTTAWQAMPAMPSMMRDVLLANASFVGTSIDDWSDEEPGKLIHQATHGPLASLRLNNNLRNYGDYATAPDFLIMLGQYLAWTDDRATAVELLPVARRVIEWIERYADLDGDGLFEYKTRSPKGIKNQGWKDADDAIVDERGRVIDPPVAAVEIQAYVFAGLQHAAVVFGLCGDRAFGLELARKARALRKRINERFWMPDENFYAMALGPDKRQVRSITSNPAHLLACGAVPRSRARAVADRLMEADMFSGWGIRTLSAANAAYNPFSYHRGSVWPVENATAALGLARYGFWDHLHTLTDGLFSLSAMFAEGRLPEAVGGMQRDAAHPHPGVYPASCEPQSWSASMVVMLVQTLAGMFPVAPLRLLVVDPHLPDWLPDLRLSDVRVGDATVDLEMERRADGTTGYRWRARGKLRVVRQPPPEERAGAGRRAWSLIRSLI